MIIKSAALLFLILLIFTIENIGVSRGDARDQYWIFFLGIAPNFFSTLILSFVFLILLKKPMSYSIGVCLGIAIYEILQIYMPERTFDIFDIIASLLGLAVTLCIYQLFKIIQ
jgi:VanZ family protein